MSQDKKSQSGYKNPPKETRFKKGQSGNPKGRPKVENDIEKILENILFGTVIARENGRKREVTMIEAAFIQQMSKAAKGDPKAFQLILKHYTAIKGKVLGEKNEPLPWNDDD